jgi:undecaprenyl-phosphate 4-deoxy-4-formamido-L-arabinose transferase
MRRESMSVVIPVYNSEGSLGELVARLYAVLLAEQVPFEIILVNDGSRDRSWSVVCGLQRDYREVRGIDLSRNFGQHNALLCGIRAARHAVVITMDDDLQHPPEEIPKLLRQLEAGFDVVYGTPEHEPHGWWRGTASRLTKQVLARVMANQVVRGHSAFRAFRTSLREAFHDYRSPQVQIDALLSWGTTRFASVAVQHQPRSIGASNYTFSRLVAHTINMFTGFTTLPLKLASWIGFATMAFGLFVLVWVLGNYLVYGSSQPGFAFLASIITVFAGAQLFALGILGEYLGRVHFRLMDKPPYLVRQEAVTVAPSLTAGNPHSTEENAA